MFQTLTHKNCINTNENILYRFYIQSTEESHKPNEQQDTPATAVTTSSVFIREKASYSTSQNTFQRKRKGGKNSLITQAQHKQLDFNAFNSKMLSRKDIQQLLHIMVN